MDLLMMNIEVFSDEEEDEIFELIRTPYTIKYRPNYMVELDDIIFYSRFRLKKVTATILLEEIQQQVQVQWNHFYSSFTGGDNAELFRNRKWFFSINTQVVCDHNLKAIDCHNFQQNLFRVYRN
ncbi:arthropod cardioacceleratory peptide 2a [Holotrichia oblita]|uniref:Arthropod cardioacceleratory peptide 2a n=1 Tax=Holotrichia oblita TaxID=644536 RepID=A0ACB9TPM9_HOLOL|nr:arthropod cardioacceleratory peptide 2a [Holotrichia oblita]